MTSFSFVESSADLSCFAPKVQEFFQRPGSLPATNSSHYQEVAQRAYELGLNIPIQALRVFAAFRFPGILQGFLTQLKFRTDPYTHRPSATCEPPLNVLRDGEAHCFEGAMLAYTAGVLNGQDPHVHLLENHRSWDHNLVLFQDPTTGKYGCFSKGTGDGRPAIFESNIALALNHQVDYVPGSGNPWAVSDPISLSRFGHAWMGQTIPLTDIYDGYIDGGVQFTDLHTGERRPHSLIHALRNRWLVRGDNKTVQVVPEHFPPQGQQLWQRRQDLIASNAKCLYGEESPYVALERGFTEAMGMTPWDLTIMARDLELASPNLILDSII